MTKLSFLPQSFRLSPTITVISLLLSGVMLCCAVWQWERYQFKRELLATYDQNSLSLPIPFSIDRLAPTELNEILYKKIQVRGEYDYSRQLIITNRKGSVGPGHWLVTPLKIAGSEPRILVSRGYIPYADAEPVSWKKFDFALAEDLQAVVQPTVPHRSWLAPKSALPKYDSQPVTRWFYPDLEKIAEQFPYPVITSVYLQRLGPPPIGTFPEEAISIEVPPSTHFGYTIEWILLAIATLAVGFLLQAYPKRKSSHASPKKIENTFVANN